MKNSRKKLNDICWQIVNHYNGLNIRKVKVKTPYYINNLRTSIFPLMRKANISEKKMNKFYSLYKNNQAPFGWYRGKGTPQELEKAVINISNEVGFDLIDLSPMLIREFMKLYGLGVDCSGFVYNVLDLSLKKTGFKFGLPDVLNLPKDVMNDVYHVGVESFYLNSQPVSINDIQPLDIVIVMEGKEPDHMAIILEKKKKLFICQSTIGLPETGINITRLYTDRHIRFEYKTEGRCCWENLLKVNKLEFRRLLLSL